MKSYDVILVKGEMEWSYNVNTLEEVKNLIDWAIEHGQEVKSIKGRKR